jgi:hypothetical protein
MANIEIKPENSVEIIQRAYTYLERLYSDDKRNIVDYTYRFTYKSYMRNALLVINDDKVPYRTRNTSAKRYQTTLSGFLFVNARLHTHYFFLPEESLIIEYDNGKFNVLDFLYSDKRNDDDYSKILNKLFSSLNYEEFACFKNFNTFVDDHIIESDFEVKLTAQIKDKLRSYLSVLSTSRYYAPQCVHRYNGIFNYWVKHFFNLNDERSYDIGFDVNLDLTHKEHFWIFKSSSLKAREDIYEEIQSIDNWFGGIFDDISATLSSVFGKTLSSNLNIVNALTLNTYHCLKNLGNVAFFIPYHNEQSLNGYFDVFPCLETPQGYIDIFSVNTNELRLFNGDVIDLSDKNTSVLDYIPASYNLDNRNNFHAFSEYSYTLVFSQENCNKLMQEYPNYVYAKSMENIRQAEKDKLLDISEDEFLDKMRELYQLRKEIIEAQQEDIEFNCKLLDECIGKEITVI